MSLLVGGADVAAVYAGAVPAQAVYLGGTQIWAADVGGFTPASIPGLGLWLDATQIGGLADGDAVTEWLDVSGKGLHALPRGTPPVYQAAGMNGRPAVRFTGSATSGQTMVVAGWGLELSGATEYTMCFVHERTTTDDDVYPIMTSAPGEGAWLWLTEYENDDMLLGTGPTYRQYKANLVRGTPWSMTVHVLPDDPHFYVNGTEVTVHQPGPGGDMEMTVPDVGADALIGGYSNMQYGLDGWIGEVLWYDRALTDIERGQVDDYLMGKWGLSAYLAQELPAPDRPSGSLPPHLSGAPG